MKSRDQHQRNSSRREVRLPRRPTALPLCRLRFTILLPLLVLTAASCAVPGNLRRDPFFKSFYEKAELIMTKEEKDIYRRLPDEASRTEFIEDFWRIRDPDPGTEENENKTAFEERIDYANTWFGPWNPYRGQERAAMNEEATGWRTERGRIYIILGPPDELFYDGSEAVFSDRQFSRPEGRRTEQWVYSAYRQVIQFVRTDLGFWVLDNPSSELYDILEEARLGLMEPAFRMDVGRRLKFSADFRDGKVEIRIPVSRLNFSEQDGRLFTILEITILIYRDSVRVDRMESREEVGGSEEDLLMLEDIVLRFPFRPENGVYLFDIIVRDTMALGFSKYRRFLKKKFRG